MDNKEINLKTGVGDLTFSMNQQDIIQLLGQPNGIDEENLNDCLVYYYDDLALAVVFVEIENQFVIDSFEMENDTYKLWHTSIFNQPFESIIELFKQNEISEFEAIQDEYSTYILYQNLYIGCDYGLNKVSDICVSNPNL